MPRRAVFTVGLCVLAMTVVAFVHAQEFSRRPKPIPTGSVDRAKQLPLSATETLSDLARPELVAPARSPLARVQGIQDPPPLLDPPQAPSRVENTRSISDRSVSTDRRPSVARRRATVRSAQPIATEGRADSIETSDPMSDAEESTFPQPLGSRRVDLAPIPEQTPAEPISSRRSSRRVRRPPSQAISKPHSRASRVPRSDNRSLTSETDRRIQRGNSADRLVNPHPSLFAGRMPLFAGRMPGIRVIASGPKSIVVGKAAAYSIRVQNPSADPADTSLGDADHAARGVVLKTHIPDVIDVQASETSGGSVTTRSLPDGGQEVMWLLEELAAGHEESLRLVLLPRSAVAFDFAVDWSQRAQIYTTAIEVQVPRLEMSISGPSDVNFGETRVYAIEISNPGSGPAEDVEIRLGPGAANQEPKALGTLAPGARRKLEVEMTARDAGVMEISAVATAGTGLRITSRKQVQVRRADLALETTGPKLKFAGTSATYHVSVSNTGDAVARSVVATAILPKHAEYLDGIATAEISNERVRWMIGELQPGAQRTFEIRCQLVAEGAHPFSVRVEDANELTATQTFVTRVEAVADLKLVLDDPRGPEPVGDDVRYEINVVNRGSKEATNIRIRAYFADGIQPTRVAGHAGEVIAAEGEVRFQPIPTIAAGKTITLTVTARAFEAGNLRFRVELQADDPDIQLVGEESTRFFGDN